MKSFNSYVLYDSYTSYAYREIKSADSQVNKYRINWYLQKAVQCLKEELKKITAINWKRIISVENF